MIQIICYGRGGEGVKTLAFLLAKSVIKEGKYAQAFPEYGPERSGAPVKAYLRIDNNKIYTHSPIKKADILVILNERILKKKEIWNYAEKDTIILVNSERKMKMEGNKVYTINASKIASEIFGKNIINTIMLGALMKIKPLVRLETIEAIIKEDLKEKGEETIQKNIEALKKGYETIKNG